MLKNLNYKVSNYAGKGIEEKFESINEMILSSLDDKRGGESSTNKFFGSYVRILRRKNGISRQDLAQMTGIEEIKLIGLENNLISYQKFSNHEINLIAQILGMSFLAFLDRILEKEQVKQ